MTTRLTWQAIALVLIVAAAAVALATFTRWSPSEITALVAVLAGVAGGYIVGGAAAGSVGDKVDAVHTETKQQTKVLETVERRTNGELDSRIASAMEEAAELGSARALAELRAAGVLRVDARREDV